MADKASIMRALRMALGESGKTISDADRQRAMDRASMLEALEMQNMPKRVPNPRLSPDAMKGGPKRVPRPRLRPESMQDLSPNAERGDILLMLQEMQNRRRNMNPVGMKKGGAVKKKRTKKPKNGCTMKGRGGKYKGMR
jgi:hypothetical protein